jgi:hypothetical protein
MTSPSTRATHLHGSATDFDRAHLDLLSPVRGLNRPIMLLCFQQFENLSMARNTSTRGSSRIEERSSFLEYVWDRSWQTPADPAAESREFANLASRECRSHRTAIQNFNSKLQGFCGQQRTNYDSSCIDDSKGHGNHPFKAGKSLVSL